MNAKNISSKINIGDLVTKIKEQVHLDTNSAPYIPNIIEFCESKRYLNLPALGVALYPMQRIILKTFYRGQRGNEHLKLTDDEIQLLFENKMQSVMDKYYSENNFRELVLVLGRRCVSEDTLITDAVTGESKTIKDWHEKGGSLNVWTYNENTTKYEINTAETLSQGIRDCFRVSMYNNSYVDCTDNHPLLTPDGWKKLSDLQPGNLVAQLSQSPKQIDYASKHEFSRIKSILPIGQKNTFDLSISKDHCHNFMISNGLQMHNSGKGVMTSLIALYEAMKLLELPGGCPFKHYGLAPGNPIYIITVATSSDQAKILFTEIKDRITKSEYFKNKINKMDADRIWLLTPEDRKSNRDLEDQDMETAGTRGSVVIMSGHSNSDALLGKRIYTLLLDEVASFKTTGGASSGDRTYSALSPATADFCIQNEKGETVLDSKIISISSPRAEEGAFFKLWSDAPTTPNRLAFKLPTWKVNGRFTQEQLRKEFSLMTPAAFAMEFGAEFSGMAGEKFILDHYITEAQKIGMEIGLTQKMRGIPGIAYYAHLDPAATSHNYAIVVLHVEERIRLKQNSHGNPVKEKYKLFIVDHLKTWTPAPDRAIDVNEVDDYIADLARRFRFAMVTYDNWNNMASRQKLKKKGIPNKLTAFGKAYKMSIYNHLEALLIGGQLALPYKGADAELLALELKYLKRIFGHQGFKIKPDTEAPVNTDDLCDSLSGACAIALENVYTGYPQSTTAYMPHNRDGSDAQWNVGHGSYTPGQVQFMNNKFGKF